VALVLDHLIRSFCLLELIREIGVINSRIESRVKRILENNRHKPTVQRHGDY
jgi:hypothetical protein